MYTVYVMCLVLLPCFSCSHGFNKSYFNEFEEMKQLIQSKVEEIQRTCDKRYKELEEKLELQVSKRASAGGIAFSTLATFQSHVSIGTIIKYDKLLLNDASGYDAQTGTFTAPESGVYMFSYFLGHGRKPGQAWLQLMHNGHRINSAVTDTFHEAEDLQGGNSAIFRVNAGDRVWIETFHQNDVYIDGPYGFTTFSGMYLYG